LADAGSVRVNDGIGAHVGGGVLTIGQEDRQEGRASSLRINLESADGMAEPLRDMDKAFPDVAFHSRRPRALTIDESESVDLDEPLDLLVWSVSWERESKLTLARDRDPVTFLPNHMGDSVDLAGHGDLIVFDRLWHRPVLHGFL
jgi:hypothetical protein